MLLILQDKQTEHENIFVRVANKHIVANYFFSKIET